MLSSDQKRELFEKAKSVLENSYAPYSGVHVASAVRDDRGRIFTGVNVENASFGLTICAERTAVTGAVAQGAKGIEAVLIMSSIGAIPPCGACRQFIAEFAEESTPVLLATQDGIESETTMGELFPMAFGLRQSKKGC
ncbi:MAG TPA: cytidine deaminase [candidate division Zixibacteria bacterium]|nr:cytidine deaminase [candidate division Zixibacteria bacterium]